MFPIIIFLFWIFPIKIFFFFAILTLKEIPKKEITCQNSFQKENFHSICQKFCVTNLLLEKLPKKAIFIPSVNFPKRKLPFYLSKICVTFLLPEKMPKKEIFISPVNFLKRKLPFYLSNFCSTFWLLMRTPKKEIFPSFYLSKFFPKRKFSSAYIISFHHRSRPYKETHADLPSPRSNIKSMTTTSRGLLRNSCHVF